jgi:hypothetical protein
MRPNETSGYAASLGKTFHAQGNSDEKTLGVFKADLNRSY